MIANKKRRFCVGLICASCFAVVVAKSGNLLNHIIFSNKKFQEHIEVKTYLVSTGKVSEYLIRLEESNLESETYEALRDKQAYLIVALKNHNRKQGAWGRLLIEGRALREIVNVYAPFDWDGYVIPAGKITSANMYETRVNLHFEWERLYTK